MPHYGGMPSGRWGIYCLALATSFHLGGGPVAGLRYKDLLLHAASRLSSEMMPDDWSEGPRPPAYATVRGSGPSPVRMLLCGGGPAVGYGVSSHELSLAGHLARQLAETTGRGIEMDVAVGTDLRCREMTALMAQEAMGSYDAVFISVGVQDVLDFTAADTWTAELAHAIRLAAGGPGTERTVFVIGVPEASHLMRLDPLLHHAAERRAAEFNTRLQTLCATIANTTYVPFAPEQEDWPERHRVSQTYGQWAKLIVPQVAPTIGRLHPQQHPPQDERSRQAALDRLHILDTEPEEFFDTITSNARRYFGALGAGISFIDHDRQWFKSTAGISVPELPRAVTVCDYTIKTNDGLVIDDATRDPRFADSYFAVTARLRFYAGVPIRDPHGYMIGALCVFDNTPHTITQTHVIYLRDLATLIEEQLSGNRRITARH